MDQETMQVITVSGIIPLLLTVTIFLISVATGIILLVLVHQKRQLQYISEREQLKLNFEKETLESKLEIQENTLKNVSQEIHDNIGQVLSLVKLNINTMNCDEPANLQTKIDDSKVLISNAIQDLRDLSRSLNTDFVMEMGLVRSVEYELELVGKTGFYTVRFQLQGHPLRLKDQQELILFRIFQEALHNIIKHSRAKEIKVDLKFEDHNFSMCIADNGVGVLTSNQKNEGNYVLKGMGIENMRNRANLINANLQIQKSEGGGTSVTVSLPLIN